MSVWAAAQNQVKKDTEVLKWAQRRAMDLGKGLESYEEQLRELRLLAWRKGGLGETLSLSTGAGQGLYLARWGSVSSPKQ